MITVVDGGLATELEGAGYDLDDPLWSARVLLEEPEAIARIHRAYAEAGADVLISATYQATFQGLAKRGVPRERAAEIMTRAVDLARQPGKRVAASIGGYGAFLADGSEYRGDYGLSVDQLVEFHRDRFVLLAGACSLLACETIPCLDEAIALARLVEQTGARAWLSFSCRDGEHLCSGEPISDAIEAVEATAGIVAIGVNCTAPRHVEGLVGRIRASTTKPVVAYPNSGERYDDGTWDGAAVDPLHFAALAKLWHKAGATIIGGCCRTTPAHIKELAALRDQVRLTR